MLLLYKTIILAIGLVHWSCSLRYHGVNQILVIPGMPVIRPSSLGIMPVYYMPPVHCVAKACFQYASFSRGCCLDDE
jgi:hypothetical protein